MALVYIGGRSSGWVDRSFGNCVRAASTLARLPSRRKAGEQIAVRVIGNSLALSCDVEADGWLIAIRRPTCVLYQLIRLPE